MDGVTNHRIANVNIYVGNPSPARGIRRLIKRIRPLPLPDSIGIQESSRAVKKLRRVVRYRVHVKRKGDRFDQSNCVMVRRRFKKIKQEWIPAAPGAGTSVTPPRNIIVACYRKRGVDVAHISTHLHVIPEERLHGTPRHRLGAPAQQYARHVELLVETIKRYQSQGYVVFVTADGNARPRTNAPDWEWSLYRALEHMAGLQVWRNGVDVIAWDPREVVLVRRRTTRPDVVGSDDHSPMVAVFANRRV